MKNAVSAVAGERTSQGSALTHNPISRDVYVADGHVDDDLKDPRAEPRGGRRLSARAKPLDAAVVPKGLLRELAQAQIRRACRRRWDFDWDAFVADRPEWGITELVHRRAVQEGRGRGLDLRPTDIPTDTVLSAVRDVIAEWTEQPELRPTYEDFCQEQARRGEKGRETQQALAVPRNVKVLALVQAGVSDAEIARRVGLHRSQVGRIRKSGDTASGALQRVGDAPVFPAPEVPPAERWPVVQFMRQTGATLDADDARWLAEVGRCYEAEGREDELLYAIQASASACRDSWAYLQRCVANRGDARTVTSQLLGDVLTWAGEQSLQYALTAIGGSYVRRPLPYLRRTLQCAVSAGQRPSGGPERPVALALAMCRQWAPELVVVDADEAVAAEDAAGRVGHVESYRRRFGRLPWEADESVSDCCNGLKRSGDDDLNSLSLISEKFNSSPGTIKANTTLVACGSNDGQAGRMVADFSRISGSAPWEREKSEHALNVPDLPDSGEVGRAEGCCEVPKVAKTIRDPLLGENRQLVLEHGPCRHPLAALLAAGMVLDDIVQVKCAAGCGHWLYSDRGSFECPCHWPVAKVTRVDRTLQQRGSQALSLPLGCHVRW